MQHTHFITYLARLNSVYWNGDIVHYQTAYDLIQNTLNPLYINDSLGLTDGTIIFTIDAKDIPQVHDLSFIFESSGIFFTNDGLKKFFNNK